jgi:hypothetical protein
MEEKITEVIKMLVVKVKLKKLRGNFKYVQMFYNYYAGKPNETKDISLTSEQPLFDLD